MNLFSIEKPHFYGLVGKIADVDQYVAKLHVEAKEQLALRVLRGTRMTNMEGFYDELASALQFPLYFGKNWNALDECLADLEWMPSKAYLLIFADAPSVLAMAGEGDTEAFFRLLSRISQEWTDGNAGAERKPKPFHVVLHVKDAEADQFLDRIETAIGQPVPKVSDVRHAN